MAGAWVTVPGGATQPDANGGFARSGNLLSSKARPVLTGDGPAFYDRARARWVPVGQKAISDDGATYVYVTGSGPSGQRLHVVTVSTAQDRAIALPATQPMETWMVLQYTSGSVYLVRSGSEGPGTPGLWQVDPSSGQTRQLFSDRTPVAVQGQAAWFEGANPADPHPVADQRNGGALPDEIEQRALPGGPLTPWYFKGGSAVQLVGVDTSGHPFVAVSQGQASTDAMQLFVVTAPEVASQIYQGTVADIDGLSVNFTDQHGTWFGGDRSVYLYPKGGSLTQVSNSAGRPAGRCA